MKTSNAIHGSETGRRAMRLHRRGSPFGLLAAAACVLLAGDAQATLNTARPHYMNIQGSGCWGKVKEFSQSAAKREDYQAVYNLGNYCVNTLEELVDELDRIGASFRDDQNRSWASSIRRDAVEAAKKAIESAKKVRATAQIRTNSKDELGRLDEDLKKLSQEFNELNEAHKKRLSELARAVDDIGRRWKEAAKDDLPAYERAVERVGRIRRELIDLQRQASEQSKRSADAVEDAEEAWSGGTRQQIESAYRSMFENINRERSAEEKVDSKLREYKEAIEDRDEEWERFVREAKESTALLTKDVAQTVDRMGEFGREYKPF